LSGCVYEGLSDRFLFTGQQTEHAFQTGHITVELACPHAHANVNSPSTVERCAKIQKAGNILTRLLDSPVEWLTRSEDQPVGLFVQVSDGLPDHGWVICALPHEHFSPGLVVDKRPRLATPPTQVVGRVRD